MSEIIGSPSINLTARYDELFRNIQTAQGKLESSFKESNKRIAAAQSGAMREMQGIIDRLNGRQATRELQMIAQAVSEMGGISKLSSDAVKRLTADVERLAAAGAKVPKDLAGLTPGSPGKLGAVVQSLGTGGGLSGALAAIGPAGIAAAGVVATVGGAAAAAASEFVALAGEAEKWSNIASSTGLGVEAVQQLTAFLEDAGIPAENLTVAMKNLQKEVASGGKDLEKLGFDVSKLQGQTPEGMFAEVARQIASIEDPAMRTQAALAAFGRTGTELLPVMTDIAAGSYKMYAALGQDGVKALTDADQAIDRLGRSWDDLKKRALSAVAVMATGPGQFGVRMREKIDAAILGAGGTVTGLGDQRTAADLAKNRMANAAAQGGGPQKFSSLEEDLADDFKKTAATLDLRKEVAGEEKRAAEERLRKVKEQTAAEVALLKAREDALAADRRREDALAAASFGAEGRPTTPSAGLGIDAMIADKARYDQGVTNAKAAAKAGLGADQIKAKLEAMGLSASEAAKIVDQYVKKQDEAKKGTFTFAGSLANLANLLQSIGGPVGKLGGMIAGIAGGASGIGGGLDNLEKAKGLTGTKGLLAKFGSYGEIATAALSIGSSIVGGIKSIFGGGKLKKEAKEAGEILGKSVSKEQLQGLKDAYEQAKRDGKTAAKDFKSYLREQRYEEDKAKRESAAQEKAARQQEREQGLEQAKAGIEAMQQALEKGNFSDAAKAAFGQMAEEVRQVLLKAGMGYAFDSRLQGSEGYNAAQGLAGGAAQTIAGMRTANGAVSEGMMAAGGTIAKETMAAAVAAAKEAGLSDAEAQQAGFGAISGLLREQLNASLASGRELDANTKALIEEAKQNGIDIIADPMVESVAVEKEMLAELKRVNGQGGGSRDSGDGDTGGRTFRAAGGLRPVTARNSGVINYHPNELVSRNGQAFRSTSEGFMPYKAGDQLFVLPSHLLGSGRMIHAARGYYDPDDIPETRSGYGGGGGGAGAGTGAGGADSGSAASAATTTAAVEEVVARILSQVQPVQLQAPTTIQIVDNSMVKTEEGQRQFEKHTVGAIQAALDQRHAGLERRIEKIAERKIRDMGL